MAVQLDLFAAELTEAESQIAIPGQMEIHNRPNFKRDPYYGLFCTLDVLMRVQ